MTYAEFENLPMAERAQLLREKGNFLMTREGLRYSVSLYAIADFFAELWLNMEKSKVIDVKPFRESWRLNAFLDDLDLKDLL
jgi:hypothetical protein